MNKVGAIKGRQKRLIRGTKKKKAPAYWNDLKKGDWYMASVNKKTKTITIKQK